MNAIDKMKQIERVDSLIRRKSTGNPSDLAYRLGISERQVYNLINDMKQMGAPIFFCNENQSYSYREEVTFSFGFTPVKNELQKLMGGCVNKRFTFWLSKNHINFTH